jgi:hypothetical protein
MPEIELSPNLKKELKERLQYLKEKRKRDVEKLRTLLYPYFPDVKVFMDENGRIIIKIVDEILKDTDFKIVYDLIKELGYSGMEFEVYGEKKDKVGVTFFI